MGGACRARVSLPAHEALKEKVVDVVANDVPDLLKKIHGRTVKTAAGERSLNTTDATLMRVEPDWRTRFLAVITHPSIALVLMMIGVYGLMFEFINPGMVLPGVVGAIALLIALFALQMLPVSYAGLGLVLLGLSFMVAEIFVPSYGSLGIGGVIAFIVGALMLIDRPGAAAKRPGARGSAPSQRRTARTRSECSRPGSNPRSMAAPAARAGDRRWEVSRARRQVGEHVLANPGSKGTN